MTAIGLIAIDESQVALAVAVATLDSGASACMPSTPTRSVNTINERTTATTECGRVTARLTGEEQETIAAIRSIL